MWIDLSAVTRRGVDQVPTAWKNKVKKVVALQKDCRVRKNMAERQANARTWGGKYNCVLAMLGGHGGFHDQVMRKNYFSLRKIMMSKGKI